MLFVHSLSIFGQSVHEIFIILLHPLFVVGQFVERFSIHEFRSGLSVFLARSLKRYCFALNLANEQADEKVRGTKLPECSLWKEA
jgi:hypothetical protein